MDPRFLVDHQGSLSCADGQSPLAGRPGYYRLQATAPDWLLLLRSPAEGGAAPARPRIVLAGDVGAFPVQDLIAFLGQSRWSGVLKVATPGSERLLVLKEGEVRTASSDSPADRIGEMLLRLGYVTKPQLDSVLSDTPPSRVGKVLVERGLLKSHDLYKCLQEQIGEIFHGMMLAKEGSFVLIDQELDEKNIAHNLSISMQGLLMDSIRKIDELAQFRKRIPHGKLFVHKKKGSDGQLEPDEDHLLGLVDNKRTVLELGQAAKVSEFDATRIVYRLLEGGYVQLAQAGASAAAAPAKATVETGPLDEHRVLRVFNVIFREVRDEVARHGNLDAFLSSANAALRGSGVSTSRVLAGQSFEPDGTLDAKTVTQQYAKLKADGNMGTEPLMTLKQALSDVMFFLLFQAGELLETRADEDLARRVKELLADIESK